MPDTIRLPVPLSRVVPLYPALAEHLDAINQALRHINYGQVDHLPYYEAHPGYHLAMRAELSPVGLGRPPQIGHWHIEVARDGDDHVLMLQGKHREDQEWGELVFLCGPTDQARALSEDHEP